jgi:trehalose 6-phosphate phosphatase
VVANLASTPVALQPGDLAKLAPCAASAYFLDVDGTLLEIQPRPEDVAADAILLRLLTQLAAAVQGALALVSGRALADIDRIFAPLTFCAAGLHGADIRFPDGSRRSSNRDAMDDVRQRVSDFIAGHPGLRLEDKGAALAVHFRQAPGLGAAVLEFLHPLAQTNGLAIQKGKMVAELKEAQYDKAKAIAALLETAPFLGRMPVFIGDDLTDECGFLFVNSQGGISVRAGAEGHASAARYCLPDPAAVRAELRNLLQSR